MASAEIPPDPLADAVEAQPIAHSRLGWLASQLVALAIRGGTTQVIERLGLRWPDGSVSAPDLIVLPLGSVGWHTTSYAPGTDGPLPEVAVEIVSEAPSFDQIFERGVLTYLLVLDEPRVLRVDPGTLAATEVPDGEPVVELGGIAFQRGQERIGVVDKWGETWWDPVEHICAAKVSTQSLAAECAALRREIETIEAETAAIQADLVVRRRQIAELKAGRALG